MDLRCTHCHKHQFSIWQVLRLGTGGRREYSSDVLICPRCGSASTISNKQLTWINVATLVGAIGTIALLVSVFGSFLRPFIAVIPTLIVTVCIRLLVIWKFAVLVPAEVPAQDEEASVPDETIGFSGLRTELKRLHDMKKAQFTAIFEPHGKYMSLYCRKGRFIIELAFANDALRAQGPRFKGVIDSMGRPLKEFDSGGMSGYEADLGASLEIAADDVKAIFSKVFDVSEGTRIAISRD